MFTFSPEIIFFFKLSKNYYFVVKPDLIEKGPSIGDIEIDLMIRGNHQSDLLVVTHVKTLITTLDFLPRKEVEVVKAKIEQRINWIGASWIKTISFDNDMTFAICHYDKAK